MKIINANKYVSNKYDKQPRPLQEFIDDLLDPTGSSYV
jgi:hypothetical protein